MQNSWGHPPHNGLDVESCLHYSLVHGGKKKPAGHIQRAVVCSHKLGNWHRRLTTVMETGKQDPYKPPLGRRV